MESWLTKCSIWAAPVLGTVIPSTVQVPSVSQPKSKPAMLTPPQRVEVALVEEAAEPVDWAVEEDATEEATATALGIEDVASSEGAE